MKAVIYSRYSTDRQNESSIADQVRVCTEFAEREGLSVVDTYTDEGISGAALGNRPGAKALLEAAMARRIDVVLVSDLSRLSRSNGDLSKMIDRMVARGIRVIGVQDGYDSERRGHKMQAGLSGIIGEAFREMIADRTFTALESRAKAHQSAGGACYGYRTEAVDPRNPNSPRLIVVEESEAEIVREQIFKPWIAGMSCRQIAKNLNMAGIHSPGSRWKRKVRRSQGWVGSGIRAIVQNERYTGIIIWNRSKWIKDPDTGKRIRNERPKSEWLSYHDESLRVISDATFENAQARTKDASSDNRKLKCGGRTKYLLSGLLKCEQCGSNYVLGSTTSYACSGFLGGSCDNSERVRRDVCERVILGPVFDELLAPDRVARLVNDIQKQLSTVLLERERRADALPAEIVAITDRIDRLRVRLADGDPDLEPDEIEVAIAKAEAKRKELLQAQPEAQAVTKLMTLVPNAAAAYRKQVHDGLAGDPRQAAKARAILRKLVGTVRLVPEQDGLWAEFQYQPAALLRAVGSGGSGGRI